MLHLEPRLVAQLTNVHAMLINQIWTESLFLNLKLSNHEFKPVTLNFRTNYKLQNKIFKLLSNIHTISHFEP